MNYPRDDYDEENAEPEEGVLKLYEVHCDRTDPSDAVCIDLDNVAECIHGILEKVEFEDGDLDRAVVFVVRSIQMTQDEFDELEERSE